MKTEFYFNTNTGAFTLVNLNSDSIQKRCAVIGNYTSLYLLANKWNYSKYKQVMPDLVLESFGKKVSNIPQSLKNFLLNNKML
jgi:hypothetical protein